MNEEETHMTRLTSHRGARHSRSPVTWSTPAARWAPRGRSARRGRSAGSQHRRTCTRNTCCARRVLNHEFLLVPERNIYHNNDGGTETSKGSPPVRVLQEAAARPGGGALPVRHLEAVSVQLEGDCRDLDFLRQRPQGAERRGSGLERLRLGVLVLVRVQVLHPVHVAVLEPLRRAQGHQQEERDLRRGVHVCRSSVTARHNTALSGREGAGLYMRKCRSCTDLKGNSF